ncbi:MAG: hypothetical protein ACR2O5_02370, partial [Thiogranum sp.]
TMVSSGVVRESLLFLLVKPAGFGLEIFQVKLDFLFSEFSILYKTIWRPQGEATLSPVTRNFKNIKYINNYQHVTFILANSRSLLPPFGQNKYYSIMNLY